MDGAFNLPLSVARATGVLDENANLQTYVSVCSVILEAIRHHNIRSSRLAWVWAADVDGRSCGPLIIIFNEQHSVLFCG